MNAVSNQSSPGAPAGHARLAWIPGLAVATVCAALGVSVLLAHRWLVRWILTGPLYALWGDVWRLQDDVALRAPRFFFAGSAAAGAFAAAGWYLCRRLGGQAPTSAADARPSASSPGRHALTRRGLRTTVLVLAAVTTVGLRLHGLTRDFFYDELFSAHYFIATDSWWNAVATYQVFNNHVLYSVLGRIAWLIGGSSEAALRMPALLAGLATVCLTWRCGREWCGGAAAALGAVLLAVLPAHVQLSQSARGYTGLALCTVVSSHAFFRLLSAPSRRYAVVLALSDAAGIYFHLYGMWIWAVQALVLVGAAWTRSGSGAGGDDRTIGVRSFVQVWCALLAAMVVSILLMAPLVPQIAYVVAARGQGSFRPTLPVDTFLELLGGDGVTAAACLLLAVLGLGAIFRVHRWVAVYFTLLLVAPLVVMWGIRPADLYPRFFSYWLPFGALLIASGAAASWRSSAFTARFVSMRRALVAVTLVLVGGTWAWRSSTFPARPSYRAAVEALYEAAPPGMRVCRFGGNSELLTFYARGPMTAVHNEADFTSFASETTSFGCLYHDLPWSWPTEVSLADSLAARFHSRSYESVRVYRTAPFQTATRAAPAPGR